MAGPTKESDWPTERVTMYGTPVSPRERLAQAQYPAYPDGTVRKFDVFTDVPAAFSALQGARVQISVHLRNL